MKIIPLPLLSSLKLFLFRKKKKLKKKNRREFWDVLKAQSHDSTQVKMSPANPYWVDGGGDAS